MLILKLLLAVASIVSLWTMHVFCLKGVKRKIYFHFLLLYLDFSASEYFGRLNNLRMSESKKPDMRGDEKCIIFAHLRITNSWQSPSQCENDWLSHNRVCFFATIYYLLYILTIYMFLNRFDILRVINTVLLFIYILHNFSYILLLHNIHYYIHDNQAL